MHVKYLLQFFVANIVGESVPASPRCAMWTAVEKLPIRWIFYSSSLFRQALSFYFTIIFTFYKYIISRELPLTFLIGYGRHVLIVSVSLVPSLAPLHFHSSMPLSKFIYGCRPSVARLVRPPGGERTRPGSNPWRCTCLVFQDFFGGRSLKRLWTTMGWRARHLYSQ